MSFSPIISDAIRCRVPDAFSVGEGSIVDDFCYFSTQVDIGRWCHIANGVSIAGGRDQRFQLGDYSAVSAGAKIWCRSDDFVCDLAALAPPGVTVDHVQSLCGVEMIYGGLPDHAETRGEDLMNGHRWTWYGKTQWMRIEPWHLPFGIWRLTAQRPDPDLK